MALLRIPAKKSVFSFVFVGLFALCLAFPVFLRSQLSTPDHLDDPGFWPTKSGYPRSQYVGPSACAPCHSTKHASQTKTSMALTSMRADGSPILLSHSDLSFSTGPFRYSIGSKDSAATYEMSSPGRKMDAQLTWAFGTGRVGQSYLFAPKNGAFREARISYFSTLQNLNFTPAREFSAVNSPEEAMYREVGTTEVRLCFGCHTTAAFAGEKLDEENLFLGVTCEACHGPGAKHVATMNSFALAGLAFSGPTQIFNPASLDPQDAVDFCGACHATSWDVVLSGIKGVSNSRSAAYRLELSKCWGKGEARLVCWRCHDPHEEVRSEPEFYDHVCLDCHARSAPAQPAALPSRASCKVATSACVSCHMPKVYVPEMHFKFTDHRIHVAHPGEPYQE